MTVHQLKCWPAPFAAIMKGWKTHEYRKNDRDYQVGDVLQLTLYLPEHDLKVPDVHLFVRVTAISKGPDYEIPAGFCCMSVTLCDHEQWRERA